MMLHKIIFKLCLVTSLFNWCHRAWQLGAFGEGIQPHPQPSPGRVDPQKQKIYCASHMPREWFSDSIFERFWEIKTFKLLRLTWLLDLKIITLGHISQNIIFLLCVIFLCTISEELSYFLWKYLSLVEDHHIPRGTINLSHKGIDHHGILYISKWIVS